MDTTIDQQRERLQQQLAELELREREEAALKAIREEESLKRKAEAITGHERAEQEHAAGLAQLGKDLAATRKVLAAGVDAAVTALLKVWDLAVSYGEALDQGADELIEAGLPARYEDGDICVRFDTGGFRRGGFGGPRLVLGGEERHPVYPLQAVAYAVELAKLGRLPGAQEPRLQPAGSVLGDLVKKPKPIPALPQPRPQTVSAQDLYGPSVV